MSKNSNENWKVKEQREERKERLRKLKTEDGQKKKMGKSFSWKSFLTLVIALAIIVGLAAVAMINKGFRERFTTVAIVNDKYEVKALEANYILGNTFYNMTQLPAFNPGASSILTSPVTTDDGFMPIRDNLLTIFENQIKTNYGLYARALESDTKLAEEDEQFLEAFRMQMEYSAMQQGMTANDLMQQFFGPGATFRSLRPIMERQLLAARYQDDLIENYEFSEEEIQAEYEESPHLYDAVSFHIFSINNATPDRREDPAETDADDTDDVADEEPADDNTPVEEDADKADEDGEEETVPAEETEEEKNARLEAEALAKAERMAASVTSEEDFFKEVLAYCTPEQEEIFRSDEKATLVKNGKYEELPADLAEWLFDESREEGDTTVITMNGSHSVVYFVERRLNETQAFSSRHILVKLEENAEKDAETLKKEAEEKANKILDEYKAGEKSEEAFALLAEKYSEDPGSNVNGGLYEDVEPGRFVKEYETWCLDPVRKEGDVTVVFVESTNYQGYHIIYFKSLGEPAWIKGIESLLAAEKIQAQLEEIRDSASYEAVEEAMKLVIPADQKVLESVRESIAARPSEAEELTGEDEEAETPTGE